MQVWESSSWKWDGMEDAARFQMSPNKAAPPNPKEAISGRCSRLIPPNAITLESIMPARHAS